MKVKRIVSGFEMLVGLSAVSGGYKIIITDGLGMPVAWLEGSVFTSYFWPAVILSSIVGGTYILSSILMWKNHTRALEASAVAGFGLLIWLFTELYIMTKPHWLQVLYFGFGIVTLIAVFLMQKTDKRI